MSINSLSLQHLTLRSAEDIHELFRLLGYPVYQPEPFEGPELDDLELDPVEAEVVKRAYVVSNLDNHSVYLYEVDDLRQTRLRGLAWNALQRGTGLLVVTRDYREIVFVHPRFVGHATKSNVRVDKLKMIVSDPTRHDLDTLNAIHAHRRNGQQVYEAQAEAFNVTRITKRFYEEYKAHYDLAREAVRHYNRGIPEFQNEDQEDKLHAFTQRLLGRLMFLYFLQRKGWLGGRQRFLTDQFIDTVKRHAGEFSSEQETFYYYSEVLEPLFFETMNTQRPDNITKWHGVRIPYLNGGLFDQSRDPEGVIILPDSLFDPHSSDGLLAFFNRYNFTIADDTPLEQDVAVDPEMLGKVFENMLEERDRGQTGSFYTPRTIVSYMCQEALAGYLEESAGIPRDTTRAQFDPDTGEPLTADEAKRISAALDTLTVLDPAVGSGSFLVGMLQEIILLRRACAKALGIDVTSEMLADWKEAIIRDTLYGVDIKPEAIEIAQLRLWLALVVDQTIEQARPLPNLDYKLMAGNSLIETIDGEPVLTENANALLSGDESALSLSSPVQTQMSLGIFDSQKERVKLDEMRQKYFNATPEERRELRAEIADQERKIVYSSLKEKAESLQSRINMLGKMAAQAGGRLGRAEQRELEITAAKLDHITSLQEQMRNPEAALPFFLFRLHFSEVFVSKGGFDIVIGNPPYLRIQGIRRFDAALAEEYKTAFAAATGAFDLYVLFVERGIQLLRQNGFLTFIMPDKWISAGFGKGLRELITRNQYAQRLVSFGAHQVFDASTYTSVCMVGKCFAEHLEYLSLEARISKDSDLESVLHSLSDADFNIVAMPDLSGAPWILTNKRVSEVLDKLARSSRTLRDIFSQMFVGIQTGRDAVYFLTDCTRSDMIIEGNSKYLGERVAIEAELVKPLLKGDQVHRYEELATDNYVVFPYSVAEGTARNEVEILSESTLEEAYPLAWLYLNKCKDTLIARENHAFYGERWYRFSRNQGVFWGGKPKLLSPDISLGGNFSYDERGEYYMTTTVYGYIKHTDVPMDEAFWLGIMNSKLLWFYLRNTGFVLANGYFRYKPAYLERFPLPARIDVELGELISALVQQRLAATPTKPSGISALEAEIDALVYHAYGLDEDDIAVIEESLK